MTNDSKRQQATAVATIRLTAVEDHRRFLVSTALLIAQMTGGTVVLRSRVIGEPGILFLTARHGPRLETTTEQMRPWMAKVAHQLGVPGVDVTLLGHVAGQMSISDV